MQRNIVEKLPKVELHCHLDGSIQPHTLKKLADAQGIDLPDDPKKLKKLLTVPQDCQSLLEYLTKFDPVLPLLQTESALEIAAFDLIEQVARENVRYIEVRFAPSLSTRKGLTLTQVVQAVLKGLSEGEKQFGVKSNALLCGMRHHTIEKNVAVAKTAHDFAEKGVAGVDLAGDEAHYPPELFEEMLKKASEWHIPITLHAGECGCAHNIRESIRLGATRIGHGIALENDPELLSKCAKEQILLELCPTSNLQTKAVKHPEDYPFLTFLKAGVPICINTDNRTVSGTTLTDEYLKLGAWYGLNYATLEQLNHYAVDGAFLLEREKELLHRELEAGYEPFVN